MSIVLNQTFDPRDRLEKAHRFELENFARDKGITEIKEGMPHTMMAAILRAKGITDIAAPDRTIGINPDPPVTPTSHRDGAAVVAKAPDVVAQVDVVEDMARQWAAEQNSNKTITELRQECKRRGIKMARTDNMQTLKAKLNGE